MTASSESDSSVTLRCGFCLTLNNVALTRAGDRPACGDCGKPMLLDRPVKVTEEDFERSVLKARAPVLVDFYADWCVECIRMERNTFPEPEVQALLEQIQPIQADVTPNDEVDQALMKRFSIIGPPAILFFNRQGEEMKSFRLVGYFTPEEFSAHLQRVLDEA